MRWNTVIIHKNGIPIKVYVNSNDTMAVSFHSFGRYNVFSSDKSALDLMVEITFHVCGDLRIPEGIKNYSQYIGSLEDTEVTYVNAD